MDSQSEKEVYVHKTEFMSADCHRIDHAMHSGAMSNSIALCYEPFDRSFNLIEKLCRNYFRYHILIVFGFLFVNEYKLIPIGLWSVKLILFAWNRLQIIFALQGSIFCQCSPYQCYNKMKPPREKKEIEIDWAEKLINFYWLYSVNYFIFVYFVAQNAVKIDYPLHCLGETWSITAGYLRNFLVPQIKNQQKNRFNVNKTIIDAATTPTETAKIKANRTPNNAMINDANLRDSLQFAYINIMKIGALFWPHKLVKMSQWIYVFFSRIHWIIFFCISFPDRLR